MKHIFKTIFISGIAVVLNYLINLFLTAYITKTIGIEAYGFVTLSKTFVEYAGVITIALTAFIVRYISVSYHSKKMNEAKAYYSSSVAACIVLSSVIFMIASVIIVNLEHVINIPTNLEISVKILFLIVFVSFFITTVSSPFTTAAYIKDKLDIVGFIKILSYIINAVIMIVLFQKFDSAVWFVGIGSLCAAITLFIGNFILTKIFTPELKFQIKLVSTKKIKNLLSNGIWNSLNQLGNELNSGLDLLISNLLLSAVATGQISIAKSIGVIFSTLNLTIFQPFNPNLIEAYSKKDIGNLMKEIRKSMRICGLFSTIVFAGFIALGRTYMQLWLPEQDYNFLYILSVINIFYNITAGVMQPVYYVSTLTLKNKIPCIITILGGFINILAMYILLKYTNIGAIAVVLTTSVIMIGINLFFNPIYAAKCLQIKSRFFYNIIAKHLVANIFLIFVFGMVSKLFNPQTWISLIGVAIVMVIIGIPIYMFITSEKNIIKRS